MYISVLWPPGGLAAASSTRGSVRRASAGRGEDCDLIAQGTVWRVAPLRVVSGPRVGAGASKRLKRLPSSIESWRLAQEFRKFFSQLVSQITFCQAAVPVTWITNSRSLESM